MKFYKNKNIFVAGGTGVIGIPLVNKLSKYTNNITVVSLDKKKFANKVLPKNVKFHQADLTNIKNCKKYTLKKDIVFNLIGIKGSTGIGETKVASFLMPMLKFQTNLMQAAYENNVKNFVFVSSICAYPESKKPKKEDNLWNGLPRQNDKIPGLAKRIGEIQGEAYLKEYNWKAVKIVRPSNVFGPYDDFNPITAQVIPSIIGKVVAGQNPLVVWGDGNQIRDFVFSEDVATFILKLCEKAEACEPYNFGMGRGISIKKLVKKIINIHNKNIKIKWKKNMPTGDKIRILSMKKTQLKFKNLNLTPIDKALKSTYDWYKKSLDEKEKQ